MKNQIAVQTDAETETPDTAKDATQDLLEKLIAECHAVIREEILPAVRLAKDTDQRMHMHSVTELMKCAVELGDAIGRLRGTAPQPELRQRITVERIQSLPVSKPGA